MFDDGSLLPTLYRSANEFTPVTLFATVVMLPDTLARVAMLVTLVDVPSRFMSATASVVPERPISVAFPATAVTSLWMPATVLMLVWFEDVGMVSCHAEPL